MMPRLVSRQRVMVLAVTLAVAALTAVGFFADRLQGGMQRDAWNARTLAAANQLEATVRDAGSQMRESYVRYLTAYELARHHREELLPLRTVISEETLLRYNGMLIGVFELLSDAREQVDTVIAAIESSERFWLAEADLQASLLGRPGVER